METLKHKKHNMGSQAFRSSTLAGAFLAVTTLVGSAYAQTTPINADPNHQAPALDPDGVDTSVHVEIRRTDDGAYEMKIGSATFRSSNWLDIEKRAIELLPNRTITFVNPDGVPLHVSPRAMIGVLFEPASGALAAQLNIQPGEGLIVTEVEPNLPAARAGLEIYDVIVECNGKRPMTNTLFAQIMAGAVPGDTVNVVLFRRSRETEIAVRLDRYDPVAMAAVRQPMDALASGLTREDIIRQLQSTATGVANRVETFAAPKNNSRVLQVPDTSPRFPDPGTEVLRQELDGIKERLRRIEGALESLLLLEQQRRPSNERSIGG